MNRMIVILQIEVPVKDGRYSVIYPDQFEAIPTDKFYVLCKYQTNQSDLSELCTCLIMLDCECR